jgi:hypothetical protein
MSTPGGLGGPEDPKSSWQSSWQSQFPQGPAPEPFGQQSQPQPAWQPSGPSSGAATASLVLGICGLVVCPIICSVLALIFGYQARSRIDASGGQIGGRGIAIAGIVLGWIGIAIWVLLILLVVIAGSADVQTSTSDTLLLTLF